MTLNSRISILAVTGLSGAGKSAIIDSFIQDHCEFMLCTSFTTRTVHTRENYQYVEPPVFKGMLRRNEFIESILYPTGEYYGTALEEIQRVREAGKIPLLDINTDGLKQILAHPSVDPSSVLSVFVIPPDAQTLKQRLLSRHRDPYDEIIVRMKAARHELENAHLCTSVIVNDSFPAALVMLEYLCIHPDEGIGLKTEPFDRDLSLLIEQMENKDSLRTLEERLTYETYGETVDPYEIISDALSAGLRDFLETSLQAVLESAVHYGIPLKELIYGKND